MRALLIVLLALCWAGGGGARAQSRLSADWSGFYLGANLGAGIATSEFSTGVRPDTTYFNTGTDSAQVAAAGSGSATQGSFAGGVAAGYNAIVGNILLGLEVGANALDADLSRSASGRFISDSSFVFTVSQTVVSDWIATLRPRVGWVQDNWLVYVTGGLALTRVEFDFAYTDDNSQPGLGLPGAHARGSTSATKAGWTLGAGGEYALSRNWSLTGQYLFVDFGSVDGAAQLIPTPTLNEFSAVIESKADLHTNLILIGATYRFENGKLP
jgi:opacity protein-like surface antigen